MNFLKPFQRDEVVPIILTEDDLRPMSELEHFTSKTRTMIEGLDQQILTLDFEITEMINRLNDLRKIRTAQQLSLNFMEDK